MTKLSGKEPDTVCDERRTAQRERPGQAPAQERRASHRVEDDQQSGHGSQSALSKMKMLERKRAALRALHDEPPRLFD